jgi:hypothetical protein
VSAPARSPWRLHPISEPFADFRPVLAVSLLRRHAGEWEILAGVRTPAANRTHPDVVSVPTLRVPEVVARSWPERDDGTVMREVENLLARKLGVADALELGQISLARRHFGGWQGTSVIGEDEDGLRTEDLTMFNACVEVLSGSDLFPERTASYDPLRWARVSDFLRMVRTREVAHLGVDLDPIQFCAYGLCLTSAERVLAEWAELLGEH